MLEKPTRKLVEEFVIPSADAKAFLVKGGQILRVTAHEGKQVSDMRFINANNHKEQHCSWWSAHLNSLEYLGGSKRITKVYSKPPYERVMLTVIADQSQDHFFDGCCSPRTMGHDIAFGSEDENWMTCEDLMAKILKPYGIAHEDIDTSSTFNAFMPIRYKDDEFGKFVNMHPACVKGTYIEYLAHMDIIVAATSCPQVNIINDFDPKGMLYQIYEVQ